MLVVEGGMPCKNRKKCRCLLYRKAVQASDVPCGNKKTKSAKMEHKSWCF